MIKITLPLPSRDLTPHTDGNKWTKIHATKKARKLAHLAALQHRKAHLERATILYRFHFPDNCRRDTVNYLQRCKPYIDGIVDARVISGDHWQVLEVLKPEVCIDRENPRVELVFSPLNSSIEGQI